LKQLEAYETVARGTATIFHLLTNTGSTGSAGLWSVDIASTPTSSQLTQQLYSGMQVLTAVLSGLLPTFP